MSLWNPATEAALTSFSPTIFGAVEIVLPSHTIRLLDGSGTVTFDGKTFTGSDATYGVIYAVDDFADGTGDEAPALGLTMAPASSAAAADLSSAVMQGSQVSMWIGVVDQTTGLVIGEPLLFFLGLLDVPTLKGEDNSRLVDLDITSVFEDFFLSDDGVRLSDSYHRFVWPGENGLKQATGVAHKFYWGENPPSGVAKATGRLGHFIARL